MFSQSLCSFQQTWQRAEQPLGSRMCLFLTFSDLPSEVSALVYGSVPVLDVEARGRGKASGSSIDPLMSRQGKAKSSSVDLVTDLAHSRQLMLIGPIVELRYLL